MLQYKILPASLSLRESRFPTRARPPKNYSWGIPRENARTGNRVIFQPVSRYNIFQATRITNIASVVFVPRIILYLELDCSSLGLLRPCCPGGITNVVDYEKIQRRKIATLQEIITRSCRSPEADPTERQILARSRKDWRIQSIWGHPGIIEVLNLQPLKKLRTPVSNSRSLNLAFLFLRMLSNSRIFKFSHGGGARVA